MKQSVFPYFQTKMQRATRIPGSITEHGSGAMVVVMASRMKLIVLFKEYIMQNLAKSARQVSVIKKKKQNKNNNNDK